MRTHWRDCQEWKDCGLKLTTTSNEACKLYDASLSQLVGWYNDDTLGGLRSCLTNIQQADANFVMGQVLSTGLALMTADSPVGKGTALYDKTRDVAAFAETVSITDREKLHVKALLSLGAGDLQEAVNIFEDILVTYPTDILALKLSIEGSLYLGQQTHLRDNVARVLPYWKTDMPLYGYVHGMYAFGLEENANYQDAEKHAHKALEINRHDAWATHALAHVMEMQGRFDEGVSVMEATVKDWSPSDMLACHNFWHWALYCVEKGDYQSALSLYDAEVGRRAMQSGGVFPITDAVSLLYRLEMEGQKVGERWTDLFERIRPHLEDHTLVFKDAHLLIGCVAAKETEAAAKMMTSLSDYVQSDRGHNCTISRDVGMRMFKAVLAYGDGDPAQAVDLLYPVRSKIPLIGHSTAQRDVFSQLLIQTALRSPTNHHHRIARQLLYERKALKENSPLTDRLMAKAMSLQVE